MPTRPRLTRSIPFWGLVVVSVATIAGGWFITTDKIGSMTTTLTDGTATGVDVYVGQSLAQLGSILIGAGVIGILLALGVAAVATLRPHAPVEVVEPIDWTAEAQADAEQTPDTAEESAGTTAQADDVPAETVDETVAAR